MKFWQDTDAEPESPQLVFRDPSPITGEFRSEAWLGGYVASVTDDTSLHLVFDDVRFRSVSGWVDGDFNVNQELDVADLNALQKVVRAVPASETDVRFYDLTTDERVDQDDIATWVHSLANTYFGDANLDGEFNSSDLISVLAAGTYETDVDAGWASGDFDGSGRFDTGDLILALADGGYERGPRAAVGVVPEPCGLLLLALGIFGLAVKRRSGC